MFPFAPFELLQKQTLLFVQVLLLDDSLLISAVSFICFFRTFGGPYCSPRGSVAALPYNKAFATPSAVAAGTSHWHNASSQTRFWAFIVCFKLSLFLSRTYSNSPCVFWRSLTYSFGLAVADAIPAGNSFLPASSTPLPFVLPFRGALPLVCTVTSSPFSESYDHSLCPSLSPSFLPKSPLHVTFHLTLTYLTVATQSLPEPNPYRCGSYLVTHQFRLQCGVTKLPLNQTRATVSTAMVCKGFSAVAVMVPSVPFLILPPSPTQVSENHLPKTCSSRFHFRV